MKSVAITMGEPGGIGPEVAVKAAVLAVRQGLCRPVLVGDAEVFASAMKQYGPGLELKRVTEPAVIVGEAVQVVDTGPVGEFTPGGPSPEGGRASVAAIRHALGLTEAGQVHAMVTAPISKEALRMAGFQWPGHTEMLAEMTGAGQYAMMLMGGGLRVMLVTIHVAISEVPRLLTRASVLRTIMLAVRASAMLGIGSPRIAVCGLNPHAGEAGMFGTEEHETIAPAVREAQAAGVTVGGPYPPDTVMHRATGGQFDIVVCMYHDQGLIPLKLLAFDSGVNVTVGLPVIRTSPDHGTAYDIAGKGIADPNSTLEAVKAALSLRL